MRRLFYVVLIVSVACFSHPAIAKDKASALPDELILSGDDIIDVQIEGQPVRLQVRPDTYGFVTLNAEAGTRLALNFDKVAVAFGYRIGPNMVETPTKVLRINLGAKDEKNRIAWATRHQATTVADGIISPTSLPYKRVTFNLRETVQAPVQQYTLPLDNFGFLGIEGIGTTVKTGKAKVQVKFSLTNPDNLIDASTANWFANWRGGAFVDAPKELEIAFGIKRPVRRLQISEAIAVGPFMLNSMLARTGDNGDVSGIKSDMAEDVPAVTDVPSKVDADEIVVTGKKQKDENNTIPVTLGSDFLKSCTALTYDFDKREIRMMCAAPN
jgi:hypothetical protein